MTCVNFVIEGCLENASYRKFDRSFFVNEIYITLICAYRALASRFTEKTAEDIM